GAVTLESRRIHWVQGQLLYGIALLRALCFHYRSPMMEVAIDGETRSTPTLALTVTLGRREGNFVLAPDALVDDGLFDYVHVGDITRWELLRRVPALIRGTLPANHPKLWRGRCRQVHILSQEPLIAHLDGELFCRPKQN